MSLSTRLKRRENAVAKTKLETTEQFLPVPESERVCPKCGDETPGQVGGGKSSTVIDYVPGYFRRRVYRRETLKCQCGKHMVTAPAPEKALEGCRYSERFVAHLMVSKCADSIPLYRLEKQYKRAGLKVSRSTMNELLHSHAALLEPLFLRLLQRIGSSEIVLADETTIKMHNWPSKAWMWVFIADNLIGFRFSRDRSGRTPREVLGSSQGTLLVDAYTGYNSVTGTESRDRAGCMAHARRKLLEAGESDDSVDEASSLIRKVYRVEHDAKEAGIARTEQHLMRRQQHAAPLMDTLKAGLDERDGHHPPKSKMGAAIRYSTNNWTELTRFDGCSHPHRQ